MPSSENNRKKCFGFTENPGDWFSFPGDLVDFQESPGKCGRLNMYDIYINIYIYIYIYVGESCWDWDHNDKLEY